MYRRFILYTVICFFLLPLWFLVNQCLAASFSAEMIETDGGLSQTSRIFVRGNRYRLEVTDGGRPVIVLVDAKLGKTRLLLPAEKVYREIDNTSMHALMNNPFAAYKYMVSKYGVRASRDDTYLGLDCEKQVIAINGTDAITAWIAKKYQFPLKIQNLTDNRKVELRSIAEKSLEFSLFEIPADYHQVSRLPLPIPEWAAHISDAPLKRPPFEATLTQGQVLRVKPATGCGMTIECKNTGNSDAVTTVTVVAFKAGRPISAPDMNTVTLHGGQSMKKTYKPEPPGADYIAVRVKKGQFYLRATSNGSGRATPADGGTQSMVLILDASGSMWGRINGKPKIQIAKEVMGELIDQLPPGMQVGLMAYGHRKKGDCNDIEMLLPIEKLNPSAMKARINSINPKGKTPLSAAVGRAAAALHYTEERATVVLVSDGLETCNTDPCSLAEKLAMNGVDFTIHVIGFDLSKQEQARLRCLADKTGGLFLAAADAGALRAALFKAVEKVKTPPPAVKEVPGTAVIEAPETVPAADTFEIKWQGPDSRRDYIAISLIKSKDSEYVDYVFTKAGNPVKMTAPGAPGNYELRYVHAHTGKVIGRTDIRITPVKAQISAPDSVAVATEFSVKWQGPGHEGDLITIARPGQDTASYLGVAYAYSGNPAKLRAPADPGTYEVRYILGHGTEQLTKATITVKPANAKLTAPAALTAGARFEVQWQGPGNDDDLITIASPNQEATSFLGIAYVSAGNPARLRAPEKAGAYEVRYILGHGAKMLARIPITVTAPK